MSSVPVPVLKPRTTLAAIEIGISAMKIINTDLILSPYNWAVVITIALFGLVFLALAFPSSE